jgi:hypothetical protein
MFENFLNKMIGSSYKELPNEQKVYVNLGLGAGAVLIFLINKNYLSDLFGIILLASFVFPGFGHSVGKLLSGLFHNKADQGVLESSNLEKVSDKLEVPKNEITLD